MKIKVSFILAAVFLMVGSNYSAVSAAESRESISKVNLDITSWISSGSTGTDVEINTEDTANYWADSYEVTNVREGGWSQYDSPRLVIQVIASSGYYFKNQSKSSVSAKGDDVFQLIDVERNKNKNELEITVDLKPINGKLGNPADLEWKSDYKAEWTKGYKAEEYQVELYKDDTKVKTITTSSTSYSFASDITERENYYFRVRSTRTEKKTTLYGNWMASDTYDYDQLSVGSSTTSSSGPGTSAPGTWIQDNSGWWYRLTDGSWPSGNWCLIDNKWYYFDGTGYMVTGWIDVNQKWYCLDSTGALFVGTITPDGYSVGSDGAWIE